MTDALRLYVFMLEHKSLVVEYTRATFLDNASIYTRRDLHKAILDKLCEYGMEPKVDALVRLVWDEVYEEFRNNAP